jgi:predicted RNase H-related nuclease YkuK (DUF458 family)
MNEKWFRVNKGDLDIPLLDYLDKLFKEEKANGFNLRVCVGSDSQIKGLGYKYATAILIITSKSLGKDKDGTDIVKTNGGIVLGRTYWEKMHIKNGDKKATEIEMINERMIKEVGDSIMVAEGIKELVTKHGIKMEVHADINPDPIHDSNKALQSAVGYIMGMGYEFKIKPDAWAASKEADRMC